MRRLLRDLRQRNGEPDIFATERRMERGNFPVGLAVGDSLAPKTFCDGVGT